MTEPAAAGRVPQHIRDAVREGVIAERLGWDLNTIDAAPEWWLVVNLASWQVADEVAEEKRKAASKSKAGRKK